MTREDMTFVADALLALCDREPEAPFYSDQQLRLRLVRSQRRDPSLAHFLNGGRSDPILESECQEVIKCANLTPRQSEVLAMRLEGFTFEDIGRAGRHTKQGAQSIFIQALKKIARAFHVYPYTGLGDVYRSEVRRGSNPRPFGTIQR